MIVILALFHFIQPLANIFYLKITTAFNFSVIINNLIQINDVKSIFDFWILFPLGGLALVIIKNWSWPIFVIVQLYSVHLHLTYERFTWPYISNHPLPYSIFLLVINIFLIIYVSLPGIRKLFFNRKLRWWETHRRYFINIPCEMTIIDSGEKFSSTLVNISQTGTFIESDVTLQTNTAVVIDFKYHDNTYSLYGKLISIHVIGGIRGLGIKFLYDSFHTNEQISVKNLIHLLKKTRPELPIT